MWRGGEEPTANLLTAKEGRQHSRSGRRGESARKKDIIVSEERGLSSWREEGEGGNTA